MKITRTILILFALGCSANPTIIMPDGQQYKITNVPHGEVYLRQGDTEIRVRNEGSGNPLSPIGRVFSDLVGFVANRTDVQVPVE